ncbi:MAG TPA: hydrogenase maturation protease [Ktedonobacteraceae bacterium]|nr:hydrogenase maturation protease [Ktedonobacteraceae bacterium]
MLIIGVGNSYRGDDGVGPAVLALLREERPSGTRLLECDGDCSALLDAWHGADAVMLIDAVSSGAPPGTVYRFDALAQALPREVSFQSTHAFGVAEALALGRALGQLPANLIIYAVEGKAFTTGMGLSPEVELAVYEIVQQVKRDLM